jgi:hypothetical protein
LQLSQTEVKTIKCQKENKSKSCLPSFRSLVDIIYYRDKNVDDDGGCKL